jgi:hypothetical protein
MKNYVIFLATGYLISKELDIHSDPDNLTTCTIPV